MNQNIPQPEYKPNIYPIMYWAIMYGLVAAFLLLIFHVLNGFIGFLWFPVFLAGLIWGGYRKYKQDKAAWMQQQGSSLDPSSVRQKSAVEEFKDAAKDIAVASREMMARHAQEDAVAVQQAKEDALAAQQEYAQNTSASAAILSSEEVQPNEDEEFPTNEQRPPSSTTQPLV